MEIKDLIDFGFVEQKDGPFTDYVMPVKEGVELIVCGIENQIFIWLEDEEIKIWLNTSDLQLAYNCAEIINYTD